MPIMNEKRIAIGRYEHWMERESFSSSLHLNWNMRTTVPMTMWKYSTAMTIRRLHLESFVATRYGIQYCYGKEHNSNPYFIHILLFTKPKITQT